MQSPPLARRTASGVVVDERLARVACRWTELTSRDGERVELDWAGQVGCVDTPADRHVLGERFLRGGDTTLDVATIARMFVDELRPALARLVAATDAAALLAGERDDELRRSIETDARRAGFATGLRVAGPFTIQIDSPSVRRARDAERAAAQLAALTANRESRSAEFDALAASLAAGGGQRAIHAARGVDPLDVLRAVAAADARWSAPTPSLWIAVGDRVLAVDPTSPDLAQTPIVVAGIGPIRSVRGATIDGRPVLLVGGRSGVAIVDPTGDVPPRTFTLADGASDLGINAACVLPASRVLLATHSGFRVLRWSLDAPDRPAERVHAGAARGVVAIGEDAFFLDGDGVIHRVGGGPIDATAGTFNDFVAIDDGLLLAIDAERNVEVIRPDDRPIAETRLPAGAAGLAAIDLCGLPRAIIAAEDGTLLLVDPNGSPATPLAGGRWPARVVRARPGFVALLSVDRMRVAIIDLARPDVIAADLHVAATFDKRASDIWFA